MQGKRPVSSVLIFSLCIIANYINGKKRNGKKDKTKLKSKEKDLEELKQFDLNVKFGPCYNIKRLDRWNWSKKHGLNPPENIRELIIANEKETDYTESIWYCYRSLL